MSTTSWQGSVIDAPGFEPFAVLGEVVVAVRTPRSRDFVTLEVAPAPELDSAIPLPDQFLCSRPPPVFSRPWRGEVSLREPVVLDVAGSWYRLTLERLTDSPDGPPWIVCDVLVERV